ncbi:MAG: hypothetical protein ABIT61_05555 [Steroidobacteraceae bacterium]
MLHLSVLRIVTVATPFAGIVTGALGEPCVVHEAVPPAHPFTFVSGGSAASVTTHWLGAGTLMSAPIETAGTEID